MITINSRSDRNSVALCLYVHEFAMTLRCNTALAIEDYQKRGSMVMCRPHAHLVIDVEEHEANRIAEHFRSQGANVEITPVWDALEVLRYISKHRGSYYLTELQIPVTLQGFQPPAPQEAEEAENAAQEEEDGSTQHHVILVLGMTKKVYKEFRSLGVIKVEAMDTGQLPRPPIRAVRHAMVRAP